jgi:hypothetical protein
MKSTKVKLTALITGLTLVLLSCEKVVPTVTTSEVTGISDCSATISGNVTEEGSGPVIERGVCWSRIHEYPTIDDARTIDGNGTGGFISIIYNLQSGTTYFLRAYATNSIGTGYGESLSLTTVDSSIPPGDLPPSDGPNPLIFKK